MLVRGSSAMVTSCMWRKQARCKTLLNVSGCGSRAFSSSRDVAVENVKIRFCLSLVVLACCFIT